MSEADDESAVDRPSKSQRKRDHAALQELAREITELPPSRFRQLPLDERARRELDIARGMAAGGSRNRQLRLVAQVLGEGDVDAIRAAIAAAARPQQAATRLHHAAERWRERVLAEGESAILHAAAEVPDVPVERLRELHRGATSHVDAPRAAHARREIYRLLLACLSGQPETNSR